MGIGPITIYDKSALQALNMDESVWLDAFFLVNVVPLFYVETLADLEKASVGRLSPDEFVAMLAAKTPPSAVPNTHHSSLVASDLLGRAVPMDGRIPMPSGDLRQSPDGALGIHVEHFDESIMLERWKRLEFLDAERGIAKRWRANLHDADRDRTIGVTRNILPIGMAVPDLATLKRTLDSFSRGSDPETIGLALEVLGLPNDLAVQILARWEHANRPPLEDFAPYATHVFKVDLLYYLGIDRGFISSERASNKVDMAYLYYLPFCMVFTSGDNLHRRVVPLFLRDDQSFVDAAAMKNALRDLDRYYDGLSDEIKALGVMAFAHYPPPDLDNLVVHLWDKHMASHWRNDAKTPEQIFARWHERSAEDERRGTAADLRERVGQAQPFVGTQSDVTADEPEYVVIQRQVPARRGKWRIVPEDLDAAGDDGPSH